MIQQVDGIWENGQIRLLSPCELPNGTPVKVTIAPVETPASPPRKKRTPAEILAEIAALPSEGINDDPHTAENHDHYLYGAPKRR